MYLLTVDVDTPNAFAISASVQFPEAAIPLALEMLAEDKAALDLGVAYCLTKSLLED